MQVRSIVALFAVALGISACALYDDYSAAMAANAFAPASIQGS